MGFWVNFDWHFHSNSPTLATLHPCPQPLPQHGSLSDLSVSPSPRACSHCEWSGLLQAPTIRDAILWAQFLKIIPRPLSVVFFTFPQNDSFKTDLSAMASSQKKSLKKIALWVPCFSITYKLKSKAFGLAFKILCDLSPAVSLTSPSPGATGPAIRTLCTVSLVILRLRTLNSFLYSTEHLPGSGCSRCSVSVLSGANSSLLSAAWSRWPV